MGSGFVALLLVAHGWLDGGKGRFRVQNKMVIAALHHPWVTIYVK
jgi:hypothetical protein